jgi:hypothetical protein
LGKIIEHKNRLIQVIVYSNAHKYDILIPIMISSNSDKYDILSKTPNLKKGEKFINKYFIPQNQTKLRNGVNRPVELYKCGLMLIVVNRTIIGEWSKRRVFSKLLF